nr:uncharacterized protein LOC117794796 [Marmota flaviventris]
MARRLCRCVEVKDHTGGLSRITQVGRYLTTLRIRRRPEVSMDAGGRREPRWARAKTRRQLLEAGKGCRATGRLCAGESAGEGGESPSSPQGAQSHKPGPGDRWARADARRDPAEAGPQRKRDIRLQAPGCSVRAQIDILNAGKKEKSWRTQEKTISGTVCGQEALNNQLLKDRGAWSRFHPIKACEMSGGLSITLVAMKCFSG